MAASDIGPIALSAAADAWVSPERLANWAARLHPWAGVFAAFLAVVVAAGAVGLGAASLGQDGDTPVFRLTTAGSSLLSGIEPLIPEPKDAASRRVLADFTFLQPADCPPADAAYLGRFAEVERVERMVSGRLTQRSWNAALASGVGPEDAIAFPRSASGDTLPQNVAYTLEHDWSGSGRAANLAPILLLRLPNAEVAARAEAHRALRQLRLEVLTPTLWAMPLEREAAVRRALTAAGLRDTNTGTPETASADTAPFRLECPGPFGSPDRSHPAQTTPASVVRMPPQALYRRLRLASQDGDSVWVDLAEEGIVLFQPLLVTRRSVIGQYSGCGESHTLPLNAVRGLLDGEAIAERS